MKNLFAIGLLLTSVLGGSREEISWTQNFEFAQLPSELNKEWRPHGGGGNILDGKLTIDSEEKDYIGWYLNHNPSSPLWDGSKPTTVEFRMCVPEIYSGASGGGTSITLSDGERSYRFSFRNREMRTYRITLQDGEATLHVMDVLDTPPVPREGKPNHGESSGNISANSISFGQLFTNVKGVSEWEFIRWTNEQAWEP